MVLSNCFYLIIIICLHIQSFGFKIFLIKKICTQLYSFKHSYLINISKQTSLTYRWHMCGPGSNGNKKHYYTLYRALKLQPHQQIQYNVILRRLEFLGYQLVRVFIYIYIYECMCILDMFHWMLSVQFLLSMSKML